jgi:hypothetical protein
MRFDAVMTVTKNDAVKIGAVSFELQSHIEDLCGDPGNTGFGSLVFDTDGRLLTHSGTRTWLYTVGHDADGRWMSMVRELDLRTLECSRPVPVLHPEAGSRWAVIHHVLQVRDGPYLALLSDDTGIRGAVASRPDGPFVYDPDFAVRPEIGWETGDGPLDGWTLEVNAAYEKIREDSTHLEFWEGYDSYHRGETRGDLGWVRLSFDKRRGRFQELGRHESNPLPFRPAGHICARCGGNLASDVRFSGQRAYFYYARPDRSRLSAFVALSDDPLFRDTCLVQEFDRPRGDEEVIEKFQAYIFDGLLHLLYESRLKNGLWRTSLRRYRELD